MNAAFSRLSAAFSYVEILPTQNAEFLLSRDLLAAAITNRQKFHIADN